jgi:sulfate adenylyltransferase subunit 1
MMPRMHADRNAAAAERRALRFLMAGSVDDGKSTLTGRLLFDCQAILADQLGRIRDRGPGETLDLALLTDGLQAEREQGITIDVAYRYFSTRKRKFIIADAPGHEQYTRNMVTAAAGSDAAVILIDITKLDLKQRPPQLLQQTRRHTLLAHLLRVPSIIFAINKMDAVENPELAFESVYEALMDFACQADINVTAVIPISALTGENVTTLDPSGWYLGPTLLDVLEELPVEEDGVEGELLIPVQYVSRDPVTSSNSTRVIWGRVARGSVKAGDVVQVFPSNERAKVAEVRYAGDRVDIVGAGASAGVVLDRHVDVARGSWLAAPHSTQSTQRFSAALAWLDTEPAQPGRKYLFRHGSRWVQGRIVSIESRLDVHTLEPLNAHTLGANEIGQVLVDTQEPVPIEPYASNRSAGSMIIVDPSTHKTSGALMVTAAYWDDSTAEARTNVRVWRNFPVHYKTDNADWKVAEAINVSLGGVLMDCEDMLAIGGAIELRLALPVPEKHTGDIAVHGRVVAHQPIGGDSYRYNVAFYGVDSATHRQMANAVRAL